MFLVHIYNAAKGNFSLGMLFFESESNHHRRNDRGWSYWLRAVIEAGNHAGADFESRVKLLNFAARPVPGKNFEVVAAALLGRQRLQIGYYSQVRDDVSEREVTPQLLIHYRVNWYLGAWCHKQEATK